MPFFSSIEVEHHSTMPFFSSIEVEHHSTMPFFVGHFHLSFVDFVVLGFTFFIEHELHLFMQFYFILLN
jgi:hypothetical protein